MTIKQFTPTVLPTIYNMAQYSGTIEELISDLATFMPGNIQAFASDSGTVFVIYQHSSIVEASPGQWLGFTQGQWLQFNDDQVQGTTDGGLTPVPEQS